MADPFPKHIARNDADADAWQAELQDFVHGRLERAQKAAASWLVTLTTLLGLFGAVIVLNGGTAISGIRGGFGWRAAAVIIAAATFALAFAAIYEGLSTTFAGLTGGGWSTHRHDLWRRLRRAWSPPDSHPEQLTWDGFREWNQRRPNEIRRRLHRSRILGILAAAMAGLLALLIIGNAAFIRNQTSVIIVERGHVLCGPIKVGTDGLSSIHGHVVSGATQVIVGSCLGR
jgi:hypothetical protein